MNLDILQALARHFLTALAGWLVANGYIGQNDQQTLIGAGLGLLAVGWSIWNKHQQRQAVSTALATPVPPAIPKTVILVIALSSALLGLSGCTEWQGIAAASDATAIKLADQTSADVALGVAQTECRLRYNTVQAMSQSVPGWGAAFTLLCGKVNTDLPGGVVLSYPATGTGIAGGSAAIPPASK